MTLPRAGLLIFFSLLLAACAQQDYHQQRLLALGTWVTVAWEGPADLGQHSVRQIDGELQRLQREFYPWADGELSRLNSALTANRSFKASRELAFLVVEGQRFWTRSEGLFDPGIGKLVAAWGFADDTEPSSSSEVGQHQRGSIAQLVVDGQHISSSSSDVLLDMGGYAKGYAVDRAVDILSSSGIANALVDAGGDLRVLGTRRGRPWRIGIRHPRSAGVLGVIELSPGEAAFTSGDYQNSYLDDHGNRIHHLISPQTGRPTGHTQSVTVIAADGLTADAAATAIFVAGPLKWRNIAARFDVSMVLRVDDKGQLQLTQPMRARFRPTTADSKLVGDHGTGSI